jgi:hypothetical protein
MQRLAEDGVIGEARNFERRIEAGNRSPIEVVVDTVAAMHADYRGLTAKRRRVLLRSTEHFGPVRGESPNMVGLQLALKRVGHDVVSQYAAVPRGR